MDRHGYEALLEQRAAAYEAMSRLNGVAEFEGRDLTVAEAAEYDRRESEFDRLDAAVKRAKVERSGHPIASRSERSVTVPGNEHVARTHGTAQDIALRSIEARSDVLDAPSGDRLDGLIRRDRFGIDSRYVAAISSPAYARAFAKKLMGADGAEGMLSPEEAEAMQAVAASMQERALAVGEGSTGGYAIPLDLDPTVVLANDGAINPIRELASVTTISHTKWQGVSTAGVTFDFAAEAAEAPDKTPTLAQPTITPERAQAFVPYSIEAEGDWEALWGELLKLFADAKAIKEAEVFATGSGESHIPQGLITGASETVTTATKEVTAIADVYSLQEALPPRYQPRATWLGTNKVANQIHKFVAVGDTEEAALMSDDRTSILGKAFREVSTMSSKTTEGNAKVLAYGDINAAYKIVDRIGMTAELIPHLFGENRRPTGQRGMFVYFRVGAKVITPGAVRVLKVKAS